ncbi:peptidase U32 [Selenomonas sp. oral taxon 126]|uniref:peptidase U32 family protein n=1 Tax=Selenomonas sp. oral taxon 126 TaxID=712528 RepID=UPI0008079232|nr:U32 family peptidase [Selenomonas sp. oral taxon 126]ANR71169.1 peptidase U32 [Selenomonas sp. oral taxon 126]
MKKPELLAPAGTMEKLQMALAYGADAAYLGGTQFGLRAFGGNFTNDEIRAAVQLAHGMGRKVYVTVNVFPHNDDLVSLPDYLRFLAEAGVNAVLVADLGVFMCAREVAPALPVHISTQANNVNWRTVRAWQELGAARVVLARELSREEIREIRRQTDVELELFVHGAMCISYSGRCLLSSYFTGRDANRGGCAQSCRWKYALVEKSRPGEYYPIAEDERGTYIMNSKDLCLLPYLDEVVASGIDSLKIEGRMKSVHYVASVVKAYRMALDAACAGTPYEVRAEWTEELGKVSHRAYTTGFFFGKTTEEDQIYGSSSYEQTSDFVGLVHSYDAESGLATVEQRNNMKLGQEIEIFQPRGASFRQELREMWDADGQPITAAPHPQQIVRIRMAQAVEPSSILRRDVQVKKEEVR